MSETNSNLLIIFTRYVLIIF